MSSCGGVPKNTDNYIGYIQAGAQFFILKIKVRTYKIMSVNCNWFVISRKKLTAEHVHTEQNMSTCTKVKPFYFFK